MLSGALETDLKIHFRGNFFTAPFHVKMALSGKDILIIVLCILLPWVAVLIMGT